MTTIISLRPFLLTFYFLSILHLCSNSQIAYSVAKGESYSDIDFKVEWGYQYQYEAENAARKYLENKGYSQIFSHAGEGGNKIKEGYYVVAKSTYTDYKGKQRSSIGMGVSPVSYEDAEQNAVVDIATHDWSWKKNMGYKVEEKGEFKGSGGLQCVYIIDMAKNVACMDYATEYTLIIGSLDSKVYDKLKTGKQDNCSKNSLPAAKIGKFNITKRYVVVLTCLQVCATDNNAYPQHRIVEVNSIDELKKIAPLSRGQLFYGSGYGYFVDEIRDLQGENSSSGVSEEYNSFLRGILKQLKDLQSAEKDANKIKYYFKGKSVSWGSRG